MSLTAFARLWYSLRPAMTWYRVHKKWANNGLAICLILILLALAPFAVAQDVHHELAAADADGKILTGNRREHRQRERPEERQERIACHALSPPENDGCCGGVDASR